MNRKNKFILIGENIYNIYTELHKTMYCYEIKKVKELIRIENMCLTRSKYVLDTLSMGPKNPTLDRFNQKELLAEIDLFLNRLGKANVSNNILNDINVATLKYIKCFLSQRTPRYIIITKQYLQEKDLLAVLFKKGTGICVIKR